MGRHRVTRRRIGGRWVQVWDVHAAGDPYDRRVATAYDEADAALIADLFDKRAAFGERVGQQPAGGGPAGFELVVTLHSTGGGRCNVCRAPALFVVHHGDAGDYPACPLCAADAAVDGATLERLPEEVAARPSRPEGRVSDAEALDVMAQLFRAPEWPGPSGLEDLAEIVVLTGRSIATDPEARWPRH